MKWGFELEDEFSESVVGKEHIHSRATALKYKGPIDLKINCMLT